MNRPRTVLVREAWCHPGRPTVRSDGLCGACGNKARLADPNRPKATECPHTDRPVWSKGMCQSCYQTRRLEHAPRATCHPDRPHMARGLCPPCYYRERYGAARVPKTCPGCNKVFEGKRADAIYCGKKCQNLVTKRRELTEEET
jgi:hypothetical protein